MTIGVSRIYRGLAEYSHTAHLNRLEANAKYLISPLLLVSSANDTSVWSLHGVTPSVSATMGIQSNSLPETQSRAESISRGHSRTRLQLSQETPQLRSYSQTGLRPQGGHSPSPSPPMQTHPHSDWFPRATSVVDRHPVLVLESR